MRRTQLNFDEATYFQVVDYARKQKLSVSSAVRRLVAKQLKREAPKENPLLGLAELGKKYKFKGPPDLGINHDYYLYGEGSPKFGTHKRKKR